VFFFQKFYRTGEKHFFYTCGKWQKQRQQLRVSSTCWHTTIASVVARCCPFPELWGSWAFIYLSLRRFLAPTTTLRRRRRSLKSSSSSTSKSFSGNIESFSNQAKEKIAFQLRLMPINTWTSNTRWDMDHFYVRKILQVWYNINIKKNLRLSCLKNKLKPIGLHKWNMQNKYNYYFIEWLLYC